MLLFGGRDHETHIVIGHPLLCQVVDLIQFYIRQQVLQVFEFLLGARDGIVRQVISDIFVA